MESLKEYAKYIDEQCNKICGFFVDEYGEAMEELNDDIYISIKPKIEVYSRDKFCKCEIVERGAHFYPLNTHEAHQRLIGMEKFVFGMLDTQIILRDIERKGKELAKRLMQETLDIDMQFYGMSSMHTCHMR